MRRIMIMLILAGVSGSLQAFDQKLVGSWGLVQQHEKEILVTFSRDTISLYGTVFEVHEYETAEDTVYIEQNGESITIQYFLLTPNKLLFIMTYDTYTDANSMVLILTKI